MGWERVAWRQGSMNVEVNTSKLSASKSPNNRHEASGCNILIRKMWRTAKSFTLINHWIGHITWYTSVWCIRTSISHQRPNKDIISVCRVQTEPRKKGIWICKHLHSLHLCWPHMFPKIYPWLIHPHVHVKNSKEEFIGRRHIIY